jgi:hypothetical protein
MHITFKSIAPGNPHQFTRFVSQRTGQGHNITLRHGHLNASNILMSFVSQPLGSGQGWAIGSLDKFELESVPGGVLQIFQIGVKMRLVAPVLRLSGDAVFSG